MPIFPSFLNWLHDNNPITLLVFYDLSSDPNKYLTSWGRLADLSSRKVLIIGGILGALTGVAALLLGILPAFFQNPYVYGAVFILLGFAEAGVLLGRKTFLIDQVEPEQRTTYVAFANTAMGVVTLVFGFAGIFAQTFGIRALIAILILFGMVGAVVSFLLPETSGKDDV